MQYASGSDSDASGYDSPGELAPRKPKKVKKLFKMLKSYKIESKLDRDLLKGLLVRDKRWRGDERDKMIV